MNDLTRLDLERFAYGEDDTHEEEILGDAHYLEALEDIWAAELPRDLAPGIMQAIRLQEFIGRTAAAVLDLSVAFGQAIPHYLEATAGQVPTADPDEPESDQRGST